MLRTAVEHWRQDHDPDNFEREALEDWTRRATDGPFEVGAQDEEDRTLFRGRLRDTNIVVVYGADFTYRKISVLEIVPVAAGS